MKRGSREEGWSWWLYCGLKGSTLERKGNCSFRKSIQASQLPNPVEVRAGQVVGEESGKKTEGVRIKGLLKGARGYLQRSADIHQASEMTERDLLKDSKEKSRERTPSINHRNTDS